MTKLEAVLAEAWKASGDALMAEERHWIANYLVDDDGTRIRVAVLGKRALAMILKFDDRALQRQCGVCGSVSGAHRDGCEWGAIVKAAREIG